jgi:dTDP-4-dehydrorhamnose reductase
MRIVLLGANGQLGTDFRYLCRDHELVGFTRRDFDVADTGAMAKAITDSAPLLRRFQRLQGCRCRDEDPG